METRCVTLSSADVLNYHIYEIRNCIRVVSPHGSTRPRTQEIPVFWGYFVASITSPHFPAHPELFRVVIPFQITVAMLKFVGCYMNTSARPLSIIALHPKILVS